MKKFARPLLMMNIFFVLLIGELSFFHGMHALEGRLSDWFVRLQTQTVAADTEIVIVNIDNQSFHKMESEVGSWPWPRSVHAELVAGLQKQKPKAIVFDFMFNEKDKFRPEHDAQFNQVLAGAKNIYFPLERNEDVEAQGGVAVAKLAQAFDFKPTAQAQPDALIQLVPPFAIDESHWQQTGTIRFIPDADGVGRRYQLNNLAYGWQIPSLPTRLATQLGYPVPTGQSMILAWHGQPHQQISYVDLYQDLSREKSQRPANEFHNKIIIIGTDATGLNDKHATPLASEYPGMEILATAIDNLKNQRHMTLAPVWIILAFGMLCLSLLSLAFSKDINVIKTGAALLIGTVLALGVSYVLVAHLYLLPLLVPLVFAWLFYFVCALQEYLREKKTREQAVQMFSRFVNPHVVKELVASGGLSRGGESRQISVLFSDIRGFTTLCENRSPEQVVDLLNRYFTLQVEVVFRHGGSLDKFIGDCIMAFWGAPLDDTDHALHAVEAALEMAQVLQSFKDELSAQDEEQNLNFDVGIGIHSGPAVVGLIGSDQRREYTAIGDTVNLASRIEGLTKGVSRILVSRDTMLLCGDKYQFTAFGSFQVKGREQEVGLFAPITTDI